MVSLDSAHLPRHIAIIMDGNGRWAQRHALGRITGHKRGARAVRVAVETCRELGIGCLTLYAFSQENWQRPPEEVQALMRLLEDYLRTEIGRMIENDIRLVTIGDTQKLTAPVRAMLSEGIRKTEKNRSMILNLALSYGGRDEIVAAAKRVVREVGAGRLDPDALTPSGFPGFSSPRTFRIRTSSSAPAANTGSAISSSGRWPTPSFILPTSSGRTFAGSTFWRRSPTTSAGNDASG